MVTGSVELQDVDGNPYPAEAEMYLCRCGASENKPFCDGSHKKIDFESAPRVGA
jgi:CDGSH-type Zn-finger protein